MESPYAKGMDKLAELHGGLLRNLTRRALIAQGEPWWRNTGSPWKITIDHPWAAKDATLPDYWLDEALDLCENEITHQYFGLTLPDLLKLDPSTFEKIKKRVSDFTRRQAERLSPELKKELKTK